MIKPEDIEIDDEEMDNPSNILQINCIENQ